MKKSCRRYRTPRAARRAALVLFFLVAVLAGGAVSGHAQSALDGFDPNANDFINAVAVQPDGKIIIAGNFTSLSPNGGPAVARNFIARLNRDGTLDDAFNPNPNATVSSIVLQPDGKILVAGNFSGPNSIGGQARNFIARLDGGTGSVDSFNPLANSSVSAIAVQPDGKIVVGGFFTHIGGQPRNRIARLDATTGAADPFDANASGGVLSIAVQVDGGILAGGLFSNIGGQTRNHIARLSPATGLADSFDPNANGNVASIALQVDGKILVGGTFNGASSIGGQTRNRMARLDAGTGLADSFNPNASNTVDVIAVQADGRILACGSFTNIGGQARFLFARLDATTGAADSFDPNPNNVVNAIALQPDGKIVAGGNFSGATGMGGQPRNRIARLEVDGRLDQTLNLGAFGLSLGSSVVKATAIQPDGKILIGGSFSSVLTVPRNNMARLNTDGTVDLTFDPNANGPVNAIALQADGKILAGGVFTNIGGQTRLNMARLDSTVGAADSFQPNPNGEVAAIVVQADGKILVGGSFNGANSFAGQTRNYIARVDATTGIADAFDPNATSTVLSIAVQPDGKVLAGGNFFGANSIGGQPRNYLARLDATTGLADSFDPNANNRVFSITLQHDGKILVAGQFSGIGGATRNAMARLNATTGQADSFDPNADSTVDTIAIQADGKIFAGGGFGNIGGQARVGVARLDPATGLADSFNANTNGSVNAIALQVDGKVLLGGGFTNIGGQSRVRFARLNNDTVALQNLVVTRTTIAWTRSGSSPQFARVAFEYSTDNVNYTPLGNGTAAGSGWIRTGLNLATGLNIYIRGRGYNGTGFVNGSASITESVRNVFLPADPAQALNLSTRLRVLTGDNVGIGGFIITGSAPKHVLLRAIGPSLVAFGVPNPLGDPVLELHGPGAFVTVINNNWRDTQEAAIQASGIPPTDNLESAIDATLAPAAYTAVVRGNGNTSGGALIEAYDLNPSAGSKLANISTRAFVSTGDDIVIAGVILGNGGGSGRIVVRGIGPSLAAFGVPNALANPTLELRNSSGTVLSSNNDWQDDPAQVTELIAAGLAPSNSLEPALIATLAPGRYTALLAGQTNGTGVGLVEVYDVN
jgi:uncharacterized delta-60 repeat protein